MTGYKVVVHEYSGNLRGDTVVYTDKAAAKYKFDKEEASARSCARSEEASDVKLEVVQYGSLDKVRCLVGRVLHDLSTVTRLELVRDTALSKLNKEEQAALGLRTS